jgi:hypothetical protein
VNKKGWLFFTGKVAPGGVKSAIVRFVMLTMMADGDRLRLPFLHRSRALTCQRQRLVGRLCGQREVSSACLQFFLRRVATHLMFVGIFLDTTLELIALFEAHYLCQISHSFRQAIFQCPSKKYFLALPAN